MRVFLEVFFTKIREGQVYCLRDQSDVSHKTGSPDRYVQERLKDPGLGFPLKPEEAIIHSTSWRFEEPDIVVLTYVVYSDTLSFSPDQSRSFPLEQLAVAAGEDAHKPRPAVMEERHIISHGLRHISHLVRTNPMFAKNLLPETRATFEKLDIAMAGKID